MKTLLILWMLGISALAQPQLPELIRNYEADLFPRVDPFAQVYSLEHGQLIFEKLKTYKPLALISKALISFHAMSQEPDAGLIQYVLEDTQKVMSSSGYSRLEKQSNLLALYYLRDYLARFSDSAKASDSTKATSDKPKLKHPDLPDTYKPHTKETGDKQPGSKEDQVILADTNFATPYFGQRSYSEVARNARVPFRSVDLPSYLPAPSAFQNTGKEMLVYPGDQQEIKLFLPPGYEPLQPEDARARITRDTKGVYVLTLQTTLEFVQIPLQSVQPSILNPVLGDIYTRPVGFLDSEWPALIRTELFDRTFSSDLQKAKAVMHHLATKYLYSVGARSETDPIEALKAGAFQCDMAAYLMVGILRDVYQIPARAVLGFRAKKHGNGQNQRSYLVQPGEAHAWVEAYVDGKWQPFDPTPVLKDKQEDKQEGEKDEYSDRELDDQPKPEVKPEAKPVIPAPEPGSGQVQDDNQTNATHSNSTHSDSSIHMDLEELAGLLILGSLELNPSENRSPLRERAVRVLARLILNPNLDGVKTYEKLYQAQGLLKSYGELRSLAQEQLVIHEKKHPALKVWLEEIIAFLDSRDLPTTYNQVYRLKKSLDAYASVLDKQGPIAYPTQLLAELDSILRDMYALAHVDSHEIAMVAEFYNSLPWIVQTLLAQQYALTQVGPNAPTREVARLLHNGSMNDLKLLSILSPLTDFVLNSTPRPEFEEVRTWQRDAKRPVGRDLLGLQRFSELARSMLGNPGKSLEQNLKEGTAYTQTHRQRIQIATGFGKDDAERITIVLYDTSGSMSGEPARFQAGLISAFTARALSDLSPSGNHRHRVVLLPFDDKPGSPVKVTNTQEALDIIHHYAAKLYNTGGGTDIQAALIQAMALIADAERRSGEPLAAANIILMTDGQSPLDIPKLAEARSAIDRSTPLQMMFVAIGTTNNKLRKFVEESEKIGVESGFYREFMNGKMSELLAKADAPLAGAKPGEIYTDKNARDLSASTRQSISSVFNRLSQFVNEVKRSEVYARPKQHLESLETISWNREAVVSRTLGLWIQDLRRVGYNSVLKNDFEMRAQIADDIYHHFEKITGVRLNDLSQMEQTELKHYYCHAAGLGALGCP